MRLTCRRFGSDGDRLPFSTLQQHSLAADDLNIQVYNIIYFLSYLSFFSFLFFPFVIDGQFATWKAAPSGFSSIILFGFGYLLRSTCRTKAISGCHFYLYVPSPLLSFSLLLISLQFFSSFSCSTLLSVSSFGPNWISLVSSISSWNKSRQRRRRSRSWRRERGGH